MLQATQPNQLRLLQVTQPNQLSLLQATQPNQLSLLQATQPNQLRLVQVTLPNHLRLLTHHNIFLPWILIRDLLQILTRAILLLRRRRPWGGLPTLLRVLHIPSSQLTQYN